MQTLSHYVSSLSMEQFRESASRAGATADDVPQASQLQISSSQWDDSMWNQLVDELIDWGARPSAVDEDGLQAPTLAAIRTAFQILSELRRCAYSPPDWMVPTGEGGIDIERRDQTSIERISVGSTGKAELLVLQSGKVVGRDVFRD